MKALLRVFTVYIWLALQVDAFPQLHSGTLETVAKRAVREGDSPYSAPTWKAKRQVTFDPVSQYVSTTGDHAWVAPNFAAGDQRGPCPGLNALANHGYLPHSGVADFATITKAVNTGE